MAGRVVSDRARIEGVVRAAIEGGRLLPDAGRVVVAVSGGADSLCLLGTLDTLCGAGRPWPWVELVVAHLDHGLRGAQGQADAQWVAALAGQLGLPFRLGAADVPALARRTHRGIEDTGRNARYTFLREVARAEGAQRICVGHTRDDQVETLIMQWLRGSGLRGLGGMRPLVGDLSRPLLDVTREATHAYCAARGWTPRDDPSNADRRYLRNRVRHDLLPALARYNPHLADTLVRNARVLADDEEYLAERTAVAWNEIVRESSRERVALEVGQLAAQPAALRHRVFRKAADWLAGGEPTLEARHVVLLEGLAARPREGSSIHLPAGLVALVEAGMLVLRRRAAAQDNEMQDSAGSPGAFPQVPLSVPGCVEVPGTGWRVRAILLDAHAGSVPPGTERAQGSEMPVSSVSSEVPRRAPDLAGAGGSTQMRAYLDADAAGQPLYVRTWRPGDRFRPLGMAGEKKLHDYFVDAKVPRAARGRIPLVWGPRHLLWVAGQRVDDRVRLTPETQRVLALRLVPAEPAAQDEAEQRQD
jgi:tRNA(Ile)-lysidine synthase